MSQMNSARGDIRRPAAGEALRAGAGAPRNRAREHQPHKAWRWVIGAPAIVATISGLVFMLLLANPTPRSYIAWYDHAASAALAGGDFKTARVCYERLLQADPAKPAYQYGLAVSLHGLGNDRDAAQLLSYLAPPEGEGYPPAHLFMARWLLDNDATPGGASRAESHLLHVLRAVPSNRDARGLLARLYANMGREDLAQSTYAGHVPSAPCLPGR